METNNTGTMSTTQPSIKIVINNRNRLTTTRRMVEHLFMLNPEEQIVILDNDSSYPPLLSWYEEIKSAVEVVRVQNFGHNALWHIGLYQRLGEFFVHTDSDIELDPEMPVDWKRIMLDLILKYDINKVGLAIRVDDIPEHYAYKQQVLRDQERCWLQEAEDGVYWADTDTTFALQRNTGENMYESLRIAKTGFKSRHTPFYLDLNGLTSEEKYVLQHHDFRFHTSYTRVHANKIKA